MTPRPSVTPAWHLLLTGSLRPCRVVAADPMVLVGGPQMNLRPMAKCESGRHPVAWLRKAVTVTLLSLAVLLGTEVRAADVPQPASSPIRMAANLWGPWQATLDTEDKGEREGYFKPDFAAQRWKDVTSPPASPMSPPRSTATRASAGSAESFRLPPQWKGRRVVLHSRASIIMQGVGERQPCGRELGCVPALRVADRAGALRFDGENVLVVRVDNTRRRDRFPAGGRAGTPTAASSARSRCGRSTRSAGPRAGSRASRMATAADSRCGRRSSTGWTSRPRADSRSTGSMAWHWTRTNTPIRA